MRTRAEYEQMLEYLWAGLSDVTTDNAEAQVIMAIEYCHRRIEQIRAEQQRKLRRRVLWLIWAINIAAIASIVSLWVRGP